VPESVTVPPVSPVALEAARLLRDRPGRALLGITGPPGAGKSSLAAALATALAPGAAPEVVVVPMDGFHLDGSTLAALGRAEAKGAPDTFDVGGFVALLRALRPHGAPGRAPAFDRARETTVPGAIEIPAATSLVIVEGNYLLLDWPGWEEVAPLLDEVWFLAVAEARLRRRLLARSRAAGRDEAAARRWVDTNDWVNAVLVNATAARADRIFAARAEGRVIMAKPRARRP